MDPLIASRSLSRRKRQTLVMLLDGRSEKQVALGLGISRHTVHVYVKQIYGHFGVEGRADLMSAFISPAVKVMVGGDSVLAPETMA